MTDRADHAERWRMRVLDERDIAALQRFFDANPEYFLAVHGEPPRPDEATHELHDLPPAEMAYREMRLLGWFAEPSGELLAMATVVVDLIAEHVGHIGLFVVATALHGNGQAHAMLRELEQWLVERGAHWIRLGVVVGNARAERFWQRSGYRQVRERGPVQMGRRSNLLRVCVKPLGGRTLEEYLALVERDRPGAP